jgi:NADPH-dependent glutamate synthase beta subunit-like oxidoreductase/glutamate synthase domain-containing protein 3/NAD-dependent dihydropyrimidine dehydrogenase PreA subunit
MIINGNIKGKRVSSRELEDRIQEAARAGKRTLTVKADGQHGIGGRIWPTGKKTRITVEGPVGQRLGSMGMEGTEIVVKGSVSDDVGWINCGAVITVLGDVTNGAHNAGAQGKLYVQGGGGARCDTMTKHNPRFEPLQSWYFRDVGDSFAEFKAGGIAVVCGVNPRNANNVLGYRPCVGMVGGTIYFRGPIQGYSEADVRQADLTPQDWDWLTKNIKPYLKAIDRMEYLEELTRTAKDWKKLIAYTPTEKKERRGRKLPMTEFRTNVWEAGVGKGGIFGEYLEHDQTILPYITHGEDRRFRPVWSNDKYLPPCAYSCPSRIPSHKRASLIRQNRLEDALALVLQYSPFPASVCGQVCPNLCMDACTRGLIDKPLDIKNLGRLSLEIPAPEKANSTGKKVAVIGAGPAGLSAAWQLALKGHSVSLYEASPKLGGKLELCIPRERLPHEILKKEISRFEEMGISVHLKKKVTKALFKEIYKKHEIVVVACGAHEARMVKFPGIEDVIPGIEFLKDVNYGNPVDLSKKDVVVIGAGNVGMDIACQAFACGAKSVTAVDIQPPASFGKEQEMAKERGTKILYPKVTAKFSKRQKKIYFQDGSSLKADIAIMSIGEVPVLDFLPPEIHTERGYIVVNNLGQSSDLKVFAVGDATQPGLITHAIGQGRIAADVIHNQMMNYDYVPEIEQVIPYERIKTVYYETERGGEFVAETEANRCMSCGTCRDCGMCESSCYYGAISRLEGEDGAFEYVVDDKLCIGCGFCSGICPCGVWEMVENV